MINELEGRAPQRVIADVELTCEEEFVLENEAGEVLHRPEARGPKVGGAAGGAWRESGVCFRRFHLFCFFCNENPFLRSVKQVFSAV